MKAAVLCPGQSLPNPFKGTDDLGNPYNPIIAVNRAINVCPADYLIILDAHTLAPDSAKPCIFPPRSRPTIACAAGVHQTICRIFPPAAHFPFLELDRNWLQVPGLLWYTKGLTVALVLAWLKGAELIDCFGVDWKGSADFDGRTSAHDRRDERRWASEKMLASDTWAALIDRGVSIKGLPAAPPLAVLERMR